MKPTYRMRTPSRHIPLWREDARERLHALLPELVVSIIGSACFSAVFLYSDRTTVATSLFVACVSQVVAQIFLYVCTYLTHPERNLAFATPFFFAFVVPVAQMVSFATGSSDPAGSTLTYGPPVSMLVGMLLFYLTRTRPSFVFLALEVLILGSLIDDLASVLPLHMAGIAAYTVLYVMRCSATRITLDDIPASRESDSDAGENERSSLGIYGQIVAVGAVVGALCLTTALCGNLIVNRARNMGGDVTSQTTSTSQTIDTDQATDAAQTTNADQAADADQTADTSQEKPPITPTSSTSQGDQTAGEDGGPTPNPTAQDGSAPWVRGALLALAVIAMLALPFGVKLLLRAWARCSLQREQEPAVRAARIYLAILSRLSAVGIERDETMTPLEFLAANERDIVELTKPAGLDENEWITLTDVYEKARYASLDPTKDELEACWRIYDALPACAREALGLRRYLLNPFWRM